VLKVMIAEDDLMAADMIEEALIDAGYESCGIARTVTEGVALGWLHRPDLAIIDMQLADGGVGTDIAAGLADLRIGILFASGNIEQVMRLANGGCYIAKPYDIKNLLHALDIVAGVVITGVVPTPPFPHGFSLLEDK
jgi:two-component system, response regulator PdtaR